MATILVLKSAIKMPMWLLVCNFVLFQGLWLLAVVSDNILSLTFFVPAFLVHFALLFYAFKHQFNWRNELALIAITFVLGCLVEMLSVALNVWGTASSDILPPFFLVLLWAGFGLTLHVSFDFLHNKLVLAALLGAVFAPLSYSAGTQLNSQLHFNDAIISPMIIAILWSAVFPILVLAAKRFPMLVNSALTVK